jgi:hypothetical protein
MPLFAVRANWQTPATGAREGNARVACIYGQAPSAVRQLVVNAPPDTLEQDDQVLEAIRNRPTAAAAPRVQLQYWTVLGNRGPAANPPGSAPSSALNEVLAELKRMHGDALARLLLLLGPRTMHGLQEAENETCDCNRFGAHDGRGGASPRPR